MRVFLYLYIMYLVVAIGLTVKIIYVCMYCMDGRMDGWTDMHVRISFTSQYLAVVLIVTVVVVVVGVSVQNNCRQSRPCPFNLIPKNTKCETVHPSS